MFHPLKKGFHAIETPNRGHEGYLYWSFSGAHLITRPCLQLRESATNNHSVYDDLHNTAPLFLFSLSSVIFSLFQLFFFPEFLSMYRFRFYAIIFVYFPLFFDYVSFFVQLFFFSLFSRFFFWFCFLVFFPKVPDLSFCGPVFYSVEGIGGSNLLLLFKSEKKTHLAPRASTTQQSAAQHSNQPCTNSGARTYGSKCDNAWK